MANNHKTMIFRFEPEIRRYDDGEEPERIRPGAGGKRGGGMINRAAYKGTDVAVSRSQDEIRRLLRKYGADQVQYAEDHKARTLTVRFLISVNGRSYGVQLRAAIPVIEPVSAHGRSRTAKQIEVMEEQNERASWRAVFYALKSRLESIEYGIETFEQAFLAHMLLPGTDQTLFEKMQPALEAGKNPFLLTGGK